MIIQNKHDPRVFPFSGNTRGELSSVAFTPIDAVDKGIRRRICPSTRGAHVIYPHFLKFFVRKRWWWWCTWRQVKQLRYLRVIESAKVCEKGAAWHVLIPLGICPAVGHVGNRPALTRGMTDGLVNELRYCRSFGWNRR